jgi:hypothetical protein
VGSSVELNSAWQEFGVRIWPGLLAIALLSLGVDVFAQRSSSTPIPALIGYNPTSSSTANSPSSAAAPRDSSPNDGPNTYDPEEAQRQRVRSYFAMEDRKKNAADTLRLLALARDLSARSGERSPAAPTLSDMKEVEEIAKLAKRVKNRLGVQ